jgi:cullin 1
VIKTGLDKIFRGENLDVREYMQIYSVIHNHCTSQKAVGSAPSSAFGKAHRGAHLLGGALYERLSLYLKEALAAMHQEAQTRKKEDLLDYYNEQWDRFVACSKFNHYLWWYHQRHWIKREMDEGKKNVYMIFDLHLREWKFEMLDTMHENLSEILLDLIRRQRDGEYLDQLPRKSFIGSVSKFLLIPVMKFGSSSFFI